jgi:ParB family chromosome partitioning protein
MRLPWRKSNENQLDLLGDATSAGAARAPVRTRAKAALPAADGQPVMVPVDRVKEDPTNPRAGFLDAELDELAADIRLRGILVPLVVHPADGRGSYLLHFGARRLRAALRAGRQVVPVVVRDAPADRYAQAAENLKRSALAPLDLARFIRQQVDAGDSHAEVSRRLGMNLTTVAHHLSLLELPPVLADALSSGRCTSPRTLHELSKLNERQPEDVRALIEGQGAITREAVVKMRAAATAPSSTPALRTLAQAAAACERLERVLVRIERQADGVARVDLATLRTRLEALIQLLPRGSDGQTPGDRPI